MKKTSTVIDNPPPAALQTVYDLIRAQFPQFSTSGVSTGQKTLQMLGLTSTPCVEIKRRHDGSPTRRSSARVYMKNEGLQVDRYEEIGGLVWMLDRHFERQQQTVPTPEGVIDVLRAMMTDKNWSGHISESEPVGV